jgi:CheY-like chemotaxis protein
MAALKILVVDDDAESRSLLREVLESNGFTALSVKDGKSARDAMAREPDFHMVIADLRMPGESGLDLLRDLRQQNSQISVVLMSSFIGGAQRRVAQELGVNALLEKPFRLTELLETVSAVAGKKSVEVSR